MSVSCVTSSVSNFGKDPEIYTDGITVYYSTQIDEMPMNGSS